MDFFSFAQIWLKLLDRTQMFLVYSNVSNFTQNLNEVFQLAQIWRLLELPHNSSSLKGNVYFAIRSKKEWQNSPRLFCRFGHYFALVGKIDSISLTCWM